MRYFTRPGSEEVVHTREEDLLTRDLELNPEWLECDEDGNILEGEELEEAELGDKTLAEHTISELDSLAEELGVEDYPKSGNKGEKVAAIEAHQAAAGEEEDAEPAESETDEE